MKPTQPPPTLASCDGCFLLKRCGQQAAGELFSCLETDCCRRPKTCQAACPRSVRWPTYVREIHGRWIEPAHLVQPGKTLTRRLPRYASKVLHSSERPRLLKWDGPLVASLPETARKVGISGDAAIASRAYWQLCPESDLILSGIRPDAEIESFWRDARATGYYRQIAAMRPLAVVAPNFSMYLGVPRFDNIHNIVRQTLVAERLSDLGVAVIPHLSAREDADWRFWERYLLKNETVGVIAINMSTGRRLSEFAKDAITQLLRVRDTVNRPLHLLAFSAGTHLDILSKKWGNAITYVNGTPFSKTVHRQRPTGGRGSRRFTGPGLLPGFDLDLDHLLLKNLRVERERISKRHGEARGGQPQWRPKLGLDRVTPGGSDTRPGDHERKSQV